MEILYILGPIAVICFVFIICKWILDSTVEIDGSSTTDPLIVHVNFPEEERKLFEESEYFCCECPWQGDDDQLFGIDCPWCGAGVVEHCKDGYHCPQGMIVRQKKLRELHESDL